jgi:hypothetical protein
VICGARLKLLNFSFYCFSVIVLLTYLDDEAISLEYYHLEELSGMVVLKGSGTWQSVRVLSSMCITA